jgi:hypothetical protein
MEGVRLGRHAVAAQEGIHLRSRGKAKSVVLPEEGQREAELLFAEMFAAAPAGRCLLNQQQ